MQARSPVERVAGPGDPMLGTTPLNRSNQNYVFSLAARQFCEQIGAFGVTANAVEMQHELEAFCFRVWPNMPSDLRDQRGSSRFGGLLMLWMVAAAIKPRTVVESGVFIGASVYVWRQALPEAKIIGFDLDLRNVRYCPQDITFIENDWSALPPQDTPAPRLAFFDDHIDCGRRLREAYERGFDYVIFDDAPDICYLYKYRYPALPSVPMIIDDTLPDGATFTWHHKGTNTNLSYVFDKAYAAEARSLTAKVLDLNMFYTQLGLDAGQKWLVKLKSNIS